MSENIEKSENEMSVESTLDIVGNFLLLPDSFFIFKAFDVESGIASKKILDTAFNQIVEQAPLPIEQLMWGIVPIDEEKGQWLWYAGLKDRIQSFIGDINDKHLLPYGALGVLLAKKAECCLFVTHEHTSVLVDKQPMHFLTEATNDFTSVQELLSEEQKQFPLRRICLETVKETTTYDYTLTLLSQVPDGAEEKQEVDVLESHLWLADIRDKEVLTHLKSQQKWTRISNVGVKLGAIVFTGLLSLQLVLGLGFSLFHGKERKHKRLQPIAKKVENKDALIGQMQIIMAQELRPFELLGLLNELRPKTIYFSSATIDNIHNIIVEAVAENAKDVDAYVRALRESGRFLEVNIDNINASYQGTKFKLSCDFNEQRSDHPFNDEGD